MGRAFATFGIDRSVSSAFDIAMNQLGVFSRTPTEDSMKNSTFRTMLPTAMVMAIAAPMTACTLQVGESTGSQTEAVHDAPPPVPAALAVPEGNKLAFHFDAIGVQIYGCTGSAWVFQAPEADLYDRHGHLVGKHYVGPTWEAKDGSKVVGAKLAGFTADPHSIPWLLLGAISHEGDGRMSVVTFIQRLDTAGGLAPASGCDADHVGAIARVPYTATYFFYKAQDDGPDSTDD
jgi:Protein of unknown function (DUF3455)